MSLCFSILRFVRERKEHESVWTTAAFNAAHRVFLVFACFIALVLCCALWFDCSTCTLFWHFAVVRAVATFLSVSTCRLVFSFDVAARANCSIQSLWMSLMAVLPTIQAFVVSRSAGCLPSMQRVYFDISVEVYPASGE